MYMQGDEGVGQNEEEANEYQKKMEVSVQRFSGFG
jgi:hypothetical protein